MENSNRLFKFITYANFSEDNISFLKNDLNRTNNQIIRDLFKILKSIIKDYNNSEYFDNLINSTIKLINIFCSNQKFTEEEIEINKKRIKNSRKDLLNLSSSKNKQSLIESINLLDEIILEKNVGSTELIPFIKELIDRQEDINIIKKFINVNKEVVTNSIVLFDYVFYKAIACIQDNDRDIYYYITLLKITYNSKANKNKYLASLNMMNKNKFTNEINYIINGIKRPFTPEEIIDKYEIINNLPDYKISIPHKKSAHGKIITIDRTKTHLRDDAVSIKKDGSNYIISVYVSDAASEIKFDSECDFYARNNFKCIYIPNIRTSIFNPNVENKLSLNKGCLRKVIALNIVMNDSGDIIDYDICEDSIVVTQNLSYSDGDNIINYLSQDEYYTFLNDLYMISKALQYKNKDKTEYWEKKEKSNTENKLKEFKSDVIISELMVLYNKVFAKEMNDNNCKYIYRIQDNEYISKLLNKYGIEINSKIKNILNGLYLDSKYSTTPSNHAGLGFRVYSHSSDPLRRYSDFINQYLAHEFYFKDIEGIYDEKLLQELVDYFNQRNRELSLMKLEYRRALELKKQNS